MIENKADGADGSYDDDDGGGGLGRESQRQWWLCDVIAPSSVRFCCVDLKRTYTHTHTHTR